METKQNSYGFFGWSEFNQNRRELLDAYFASKARNLNRPVRTEHGVAAEAKLRDWLSKTLPKKFSVTSGYVIPDLMTHKYQLSHFDVIIYDALEAPVLWIDGTEDSTESGKKRAIPAQYVRAVFEVKATLTPSHAKEAIKKLSTLSQFYKHFKTPFNTAAIFFELPEKHAGKNSILSKLVPDPPVHGFIGGMILHCSQHPDISGIISVIPPPEGIEKNNINEDHPVAIDTDKANIYLNKEGNVVIAEDRGEAMFFAWDNRWHVSKGYGCHWMDDKFYVCISWSKNSFARFFLDTLARLNGETIKDNKYVFGQVFDLLQQQESSPDGV